jgi:hypothetical protein
VRRENVCVITHIGVLMAFKCTRFIFVCWRTEPSR